MNHFHHLELGIEQFLSGLIIVIVKPNILVGSVRCSYGGHLEPKNTVIHKVNSEYVCTFNHEYQFTRTGPASDTSTGTAPSPD